MKRLSAFVLLASSVVCSAQVPRIVSGSTVYIEAAGGYDTYLAAAILKKRVPLIVVTDKEKADYIMQSTTSQTRPSQPAVVVNNTNVNNGGSDSFKNGFDMGAARAASQGRTSASITVIDVRSSRVVFAYAVGKGANTNQIQSTAEACAKHLKKFIETPDK